MRGRVAACCGAGGRLLQAWATSQGSEAHLFLIDAQLRNAEATALAMPPLPRNAKVVSLGTRIRAQLREDDVVARLGGDEFAILLTQAA